MTILLQRFATVGWAHIHHRRCNLITGNPIWNHFSRHFSAGETESQRHPNALIFSEDDSAREQPEFQKWHNGEGTFHKSACIDPTAVIEVGAIAHSKSHVGAKVHIGSGTTIGQEVVIGQFSKIGYNVALTNCTIGDSCFIHHGWMTGFGFFIDEQGNMVKKPQCMKARIGNNVEIGANSCIDRGSWRDTIIGDHSKIDNLVQVRLAANSCVTKDITQPGDYSGFPAVPIHKWRRQVATNRQNST